jgi:hypothetical protein
LISKLRRAFRLAGVRRAVSFQLFFLLCGFFATAATAQVGEESLPEEVPATISIESDAASDEAIRERITAIFAQMSGFAAIEVEVREGVVSLDGSASNEA